MDQKDKAHLAAFLIWQLINSITEYKLGKTEKTEASSLIELIEIFLKNVLKRREK